MPPKPAGKAGKGAPVAVEPDPAALLPPDLPTESPFESSWNAAVCLVQAAEGVSLAAIKEAFKQLQVLQQLAILDLAARLDPADPVAAEIAASEASSTANSAGGAGDGGSMAPALAAKLLQQRFKRDQGLSWKFELVRRRESLARAAAGAKAAAATVEAAAQVEVGARDRLAAVKASLPQSQAVPAAAQSPPVAEQETSDDAGASSQQAELPQVEYVQPELSRSQKRLLAEAEAELAAATSKLATVTQAAVAAERAAEAAQQAMDKPYSHYEAYWVEGLPTTATGVAAAIAAGIPVRAVVLLHYPDKAATAAGVESAGSGGEVPWPEELVKLQTAIAAAPWDSALASLLLLPVPLNDPESPFTAVPQAGAIANPPWAAASSAAAAMKAAMAAASASEAKPPASAGNKAAPSARINSSTPAPTSAKPSSAASNTAAGAAAANTAAAGPEEVAGCKELARALLTVRDQARVYDQWRASVCVYLMPKPPEAGCNMGRYERLLSTVPPERQNVPAIWHAMLEQVCQNCMGDASMLDETQQEVQQVLAVPEAEQALAAAFGQLMTEDMQLLDAPAVSPGGLTVLHEGDELGAAACGLTTGYVHSRAAAGTQSNPTPLLAGPNSATNSATDSVSAPSVMPDVTQGLSEADVDAVEQHMLHLLQFPGLVCAGEQQQHEHPPYDGADRKRKLQHALLQAHSDGLPVATLERFQLLQAAAAMLPAGVQSAHAEALQQRHCQECLEPHVLRQALMAASFSYPDMAARHWESTGEELLMFYAGELTDRCCARSMPHIKTFQQYWEWMLAQGCTQPELSPQVYEMSAEAAAQHWRQQLLYTSAGGIATRGSAGQLAYHHSGTTVRMLPDSADGTYQLVATLAGGVVVSACCMLPHKDGMTSSVPTAAEAVPAAAATEEAATSVTGAQPDVGLKKGASHAARRSGTGTPRPDSASSKAGRKPANPDVTAAAAAGGTPMPQAQPAGAAGAAGDEQDGVTPATSTGGEGPCTGSPLVAASATSAAVRVCTPHGLMVELNTDGRVLMAPVAAQQAKTVHSAGVEVPGAPVAAGQLDAGLVDGPFAWHALLPGGTLIKAEVSAESAAQTTVDGLRTIMHPDGSMSKQQQGAVELPDGSSLTAAGWLHTDLEGNMTWVLDAGALEDLEKAAVKAAADAAAAAEAAAATAAAEAAAAEAAAAKKVGAKGGDKRALDKQKSASPAAIAAGSDGVSAAAAAGSAADPAAMHGMLDKLATMEPQEKGSIRAAKLTDPDTQAVVVTREDHLMVVNYAGGNRLLQDAEGCRISHVDGGWTFEASALPVVQGDELSITVTIRPGVILRWDALTKCVTLHHASSDATLIATPCGRMAVSSQQPPENLDLFADLATPQQQEQQEDVPGTAFSRFANTRNSLAAVAESAEAADPAETAAAEVGVPSAAVLPLQDVCSVQECWGVLAVDLCTGEAVIHEEGGCRLHMGPGTELVVWRNDHESEPSATPEHQDQARESQQGSAEAATSPVNSSRQSPSSGLASSAQAAVAVNAVDEAGSRPASPPVAGSGTAAAAAGTKQGSNDMFDDELDEERAARLAAEAAAAAAAAAAATEAFAAAEAAAAEAAAKKPPPPVAARVKPRLFVLNKSGSGYEVLDADIVSRYTRQMAAQEGCSHNQQAALGASEPGTQFHSFLTAHRPKSPALQPLPLAEPAAAIAVQLDAASSLLSLRRTDVFIPAEPVQLGQQGLKLPRVTALNPGYAIGGGVGSCTASKGNLLATMEPATARAGSDLEQVVVVRELLELPSLDAEVQAQARRVLGAFAEWQQAQDAMLASRSPPEDPRSEQLQQEAVEVAAMLVDAGFQAMPSEGRLNVVHDELLAEQAAAATAEQHALAETEARAAAEALAKRKPYKPWVKKVGPYDHCPQKPEFGKILKYFSTEEGLIAAGVDPLLQGTKITRHDLPPAKPVQPASAGMQQKPGVYLSSSTKLATEDTLGYTAGSAALGSPLSSPAAGSLQSTAKSPHSHRGPGSPSTVKVGVHHAAPLMHAGKPASLAGPAGPAVMDAIAAATAAAAAHLQQQQQCVAENQADAAVMAIMDTAGSGVGRELQTAGRLGSSSPGLGLSVKSHAYDVYGQPRVIQPSLPAAHLKSQVAADLNVEYLAREEATMRTAKTSSASLIKCSGKAGRQLALSPGHIHFGNVTVGVPAHRTARLLNCSSDVVRFCVVRPELPLRVLHKPAPLPAGMEAVLTIELVAEHPGDFVGEITVKSEVNVLTLTVSAKVLPAPAVQQAPVSASADAADGEEGVSTIADGAAAEAAKPWAGSAAGRTSFKKQATLQGADEHKGF